MKVMWITFNKYTKSYFPKFNAVTDEPTLIAWANSNGAVDYLIEDNFTQSPDSGAVSILTERLYEASMTFPNYLVLYGAPLSRGFGYFLTQRAVNSNLHVYTFYCEMDPLFYPSTSNASFIADIMKSSKTHITPDKIDFEKLALGDRFNHPRNVLITPLEQAMADDVADARGWVVLVTAGAYSTPTVNGLHYFMFPYIPLQVLTTTGGYLATFGNLTANMPVFKADNGIIGLYYVPYCPVASSLTYTAGGLLTPAVGGSVVIGTIDSYKVFALNTNLYGILSSQLNGISANNYNGYLEGTSPNTLTPGEMSYAIGNRAYSEIIPTELISGYPYTTTQNNEVITLFSDKVTQYILNKDTKIKLWECPEISPIFANDSYLTFLKNRTATLWSSALIGTAGQLIGAGLGDISSQLGLGVSILSQFNNIANEYENAKRQRNVIRNSNNINILSDMLINNEIFCYYGYRYNESVSDYNRFSVLRQDVTMSYNVNMDYVRFIEFPQLPLFTEQERMILDTRGVVKKL